MGGCSSLERTVYFGRHSHLPIFHCQLFYSNKEARKKYWQHEITPILLKYSDSCFVVWKFERDLISSRDYVFTFDNEFKALAKIHDLLELKTASLPPPQADSIWYSVIKREGITIQSKIHFFELVVDGRSESFLPDGRKV